MHYYQIYYTFETIKHKIGMAIGTLLKVLVGCRYEVNTVKCVRYVCVRVREGACVCLFVFI